MCGLATLQKSRGLACEDPSSLYKLQLKLEYECTNPFTRSLQCSQDITIRYIMSIRSLACVRRGRVVMFVVFNTTIIAFSPPEVVGRGQRLCCISSRTRCTRAVR
jgi:hypothetical protein